MNVLKCWSNLSMNWAVYLAAAGICFACTRVEMPCCYKVSKHVCSQIHSHFSYWFNLNVLLPEFRSHSDSISFIEIIEINMFPFDVLKLNIATELSSVFESILHEVTPHVFLCK